MHIIYVWVVCVFVRVSVVQVYSSQGMYIQCDLALVHQVTNVESNNYVKQDRGLHGCVWQVAQ